MSPESTNECTLNTTDCILNALTSILDELRAKNNEYNWDPLTFAFTAAIGFVALFFAALTIGQSLLAAGPGRLKSGAYAIGPWARLNKREFDWSEMRFRTGSYTPVLIEQAVIRKQWEDCNGIKSGRRKYALWHKTNHMSNYEVPRQLKNISKDHFPGAWLALLTALGLDETRLWEEKSTGADYLAAEFPVVPAYGSIRAVTMLAIILSQDSGRIYIDLETNLPRIHGNGFNLTVRQHPLLGAVGIFGMHSPEQVMKIPSHKRTPGYIRNTFLQANGYMDILKAGPGRIANDEKAIIHMYENDDGWNDIDQSLSKIFIDKTESTCTCDGKNAHHYQLCCWRSPAPWPGCCKLIRRDCLWHPNLATNGSLYIVLADKPAVSPIIFPHKRANFRRNLNTLLLQSRFWALKESAYRELSPEPVENFVKGEEFLVERAMSSVVEIARHPVKELRLTEQAYALCSKYVSETTDSNNGTWKGPKSNQGILEAELETIDTWLKDASSIAFCRKMTLSVVGFGIQAMINGAIQEVSESNGWEGYRNSHIHSDNFVSSDLEENLYDFRQAFQYPNCHTYLFQRETSDKHIHCKAAQKELLESIQKIYNIWEIEESNEGQSSECFRQPYKNQHPLDDLLIYRSVLIVLLYFLAIDSSDLLNRILLD